MPTKRIGINFGAGYVPGQNAVIAGAVLAARELNWEIVGIRDGFDGLLFPDRYRQGGVVDLTSATIADLTNAGGCILGTAARSDPFHVRTVDANNMVQEEDRSDAIVDVFRREKIEGLISVVGSQAMGILWKLNKKGLNSVCVPQSVENDVAATALSFGFNSCLSFVTDILGRASQAAQSARRIAVVEVLGESAGWLALQSGLATCADAVLIPEIPYDIQKVAAKFRAKAEAGHSYGLVVVAEGAAPAWKEKAATRPSGLRASLAPCAEGEEGMRVIERSGQTAMTVALDLQRLTDQSTYPLALDQLAKGGSPTVVDRQLGLGYGAGAVRALNKGLRDVMVVFQPPDLKFVPLAEAINRVRAVPADSEFVRIARAVGICLGD